jgi:predicted RNA-binding protein (virulence factor B family)
MNMLQPGQFNNLVVTRVRADGVILDGGGSGDLFLPIPPGEPAPEAGEPTRVFVYQDSAGHCVATTAVPLVQVGGVAWLEVVAVNETGAFLDWGLPKDLFVPFAEQQHKLRAGQRTLVRAYLDNRGRITGSTRIDRWITDEADGLGPGDQVELLVADRTELGFKAIVNQQSWGLLYGDELFRTVRKGQQLTGYIKRVRADGKLDLTLVKPGFSKGRIESVSDQILQRLEAGGGRLLLTDKSPPAEIYAAFGVSKKVFKQALGALYKARLVRLDDNVVTLVDQ